MIKVDRSDVAAPPSLSVKPTRGSHAGKTEEEAIIEKYAIYVAQPEPRAERFKFNFEAYSADDVKAALFELFHGKCAYCESRYADTQPMDVEHWRPKGGVDELLPNGKTTLGEGYPWLAARWANLLPSCIDCNRERLQTDTVTGETVKLGKANQFPITGMRMKFVGNLPPVVEDAALIINPTVDDPAQHLRFRDDGAVTPTGPRGEESIRVYALNRAALAFERLGLAQLIEQRLTVIEALAAIIGDRRLDPDLKLDLQDLVALEMGALMHLTDPGEPYSALARQLIDENAPFELNPTPATLPWPDNVQLMLQRLADHDVDQDHKPDHQIVASRLFGLGFQPNPPPVATYLRWTVKGTVRPVTLYQEDAGLVSDSKPQKDFAKKLRGADERQGVHPKVRFAYKASGLDAVLAATTRFRDWADGRDP
jgi:uncharacterized protein (TIGR02646 family)